MLECGDKIGDYTLARFLGRGQFGEVWLAEKELAFSTRKFHHALKFLFKREEEINIKAVEAEIDTWIEASGHPNVMSVLDMIVHGDYVIIVSEFAEGGSLKRWLTKHGGRAPSHEQALEMMTGILSGIEHLHSRNVVHRDLKPDNILLQGNFPRITDFGISRIVSAGSLSTVAMGSPFYMSPESFDGSKSTQTDIWSAGVLLYEMLTGEHPYRADTIYGLVSSIRQDEPKPFPDGIPKELRDIVWTALQKDSAKRYRTARAMRGAIELELHGLKLRKNSEPDSPTTEIIQPAGNRSSEVGFNESDSGVNDKSGKRTHKTDAKKTQESQPEATEPERRAPVARSSRASALSLDGSQKTMTADLAKLIITDDVHESESARGHVAEPFRGFASSGFGNSQTTPPTRPWLFILGAILALGLIVGISAVFAVKTIFFSEQAQNAANSTTKDASALKAAPGDNKTSPPKDMVLVPGGKFMMGRDDGEIDERPAHEIPVAAFYMDKYEVTNEEYAKFVQEKDHDPPPQWHSRICPRGKERFPVVGVTWDDATAFAQWKGKRLPTEEEWEFAARGTDGRMYPWGNEWNQKLANIKGKSLKPVGSFPCTSPFEICDLIGNASEWTQSDFQAYTNGRLSDFYRDKNNLKTLRGANFMFGYPSATYRVGFETNKQDKKVLGFRCAKDIAG